MANKDKIELESGGWVELSDALLDMTMDDMAAWVDAEREGRIRDVWPYLAMGVQAWSFDVDPSDPASFGKLSIRQFRDVSAAVSKRLQAIAKN